MRCHLRRAGPDRRRAVRITRASDRDRARPALGRLTVRETDLRTFAGEPVVRVELDAPAEVPILRRRLADVGVPALEADVRFAYRYCIDHGVRGSFRVDGAYERRPGVGRVYRDPEIGPGDWTPQPSVLSFDIETSLDGEALYAIAAAGVGGEHVWIAAPGPVAEPRRCPTDRPSSKRSSPTSAASIPTC
jgi:DNA polymerase-2